MVPFARFMLVAAAMIICVAACGGTGTGPADGSGHTTAAPRAPGDNASQTACAGSRDQFTGLQTSNAGAAYDQVVFYFAGAVPAYSTGYVPATDGQQAGTSAALAGQAYLRVVFHGAGARCRPSGALPRPAAKTPFYQTLLMASPANDAGTDLVYGIGLAGRGGYRAYLGPSELVINFSRVTLPRFPGIWDITSWPGYWRAQYAWASGRPAGDGQRGRGRADLGRQRPVEPAPGHRADRREHLHPHRAGRGHAGGHRLRHLPGRRSRPVGHHPRDLRDSAAHLTAPGRTRGGTARAGGREAARPGGRGGQASGPVSWARAKAASMVFSAASRLCQPRTSLLLPGSTSL